MNDYQVTFVFDYFYIGVSVWANDDEQAEKTAIERLKEVAGIYIDDMGGYGIQLEILGRAV